MQLSHRSLKRSHRPHALWILACVIFLSAKTVSAQPPEAAKEASQARRIAQDSDLADAPAADATVVLEQEIQALSAVNFREREQAAWNLSQAPSKAVTLISKYLPEAEHHAGSCMIDLLTEFALGQDMSVTLDALSTLEQASERMTSVGKLARNSLEAISSLQEEQAIELLIHHDATIRPRDFTLNGARGLDLTEVALHIDDRRFSGAPEAIQRIRFLKSVRTVYLEGPSIDRKYLEAIVQMRGIQNVKLKKVSITPDDLRLLTRLSELQHLGLIYVDFEDSAIEVLSELPVTSTIRLYGTQISKNAFLKLQAQLDDIQFYYGRGGFLGVSSKTGQARIEVEPNSAAFEAGMQTGDTIVEVESVPINNFDDLRNELNKCLAGDQITIRIRRGTREIDLSVKLKEEP